MTQASSGATPEIHPETGHDFSPQEARREFFRVANLAIAEGLIKASEVKIIYRPGTRKQNYWKRHLFDLNWILTDRRLEREHKARTSDR